MPWQTIEITQARRDGRTMLAHQTACFFGAAQAGKLKEARHYLSRKAPVRRQSEGEILRGFDRFAETHNAFSKARSRG